MFEKNMKLAYLIDFYGEVLDAHTRDVLKAYYEDDLSLSEIADGEKISRQGVRHVIKKGEEQLLLLESRLSLAKRHKELSDTANDLMEIKDYFDKTGDAERSASLSRAIQIITNKGV
jgi:predicted DNA-binding protein YlxM (UPF0122 family)